MPIHIAAKVGLVAISVAAATAVAIYESPELQRLAEDLRRRIAIALHSLGDSITPQERQNLFNRPEDAEGFFRSRGINLDEVPGVDADEETRRRQREELMYWNAMREEQQDQSASIKSENVDEKPNLNHRRGSSFDDFMQQDSNAEKGAFVFNSGSQPFTANDSQIRRRGEGARGLNYSAYTNPFADEHGIDDHVALENSLMDPKDEVSDIYSATDLGNDEAPATMPVSPPSAAAPSLAASVSPAAAPALVDLEPTAPQVPEQQPEPSERELGPDEYVTAGQEDRHDAYSSIQAWAQNSGTGFFSPLPETPAGSVSEPEIISQGQLTPTDSVSLIGSGEDIGDEAASRTGSHSRYYDVMSDDEGIMTPASWTEVGSVVSESDAGRVPA